MKTQILSLEPHDDLISIRDKLGWKQTGRVLLVFPAKRDGELSKRLSNRLNLLLIQRQCTALGAQIALVTRNQQVCAAAKKVGILTFRDLKQAHRSHWRVRHPYKPSKSTFRRSHPRSRIELETLRVKAHGHAVSMPLRKSRVTRAVSILQRVVWILGTILTVLALAAVFIPTARIELTPKKQIQEIEFRARASESVKSVNITGGIPIHTVSTLVKGQDQIPTSGKMQMPFDQAKGEVRFTNLTNQAIKIPAGTVVMTFPQEGKSTIKFATLREENLGASYGTDNETPQSIDVPVQAQLAGSNGNLTPDSLIVTDGDIGYRISVTNPTATSGGTEREVALPTAQDRENLYNTLYQSLQQQAQADLQKATLLSGGKTPGILLSQSPFLNQVLEKKFNPAEETPANPLMLTLHLEFRGQAVFGEDLQRLAEMTLDNKMPEGYKPLSGEDMRIEILTTPEQKLSPDMKQASYSWRISTRRNILAQIPYAQVAQEVRGYSSEQAIKQIGEKLQLETQPKITIAPDWWRWMPILPFRMTIITNE